jgi:hypothetical protein
MHDRQPTDLERCALGAFIAAAILVCVYGASGCDAECDPKRFGRRTLVDCIRYCGDAESVDYWRDSWNEWPHCDIACLCVEGTR